MCEAKLRPQKEFSLSLPPSLGSGIAQIDMGKSNSSETFWIIDASVKVIWSIKICSGTSSLKFFRQSAENNYNFLNLNNKKISQENSAFQHSALMSDSKINFSNSTLKIVLFSQKLERQVPKGMLES